MTYLLTELRMACVATVALAVLVCGVYPLLVWGLAQGLFPHQANGSLLMRDGTVIGSELLAQPFTAPRYFHPRPSAAGESRYDASQSGGSNLGPTSQRLIAAIRERVDTYRAVNHLAPTGRVPADAVTASASGLDPHISVANARLQAGRVARARGLSDNDVLAAIEAHTAGRTLGLLGEPRVNVLQLNLALDAP
jgi:potassium-transporting ATPase KdpC subunit